MATQQDQHRQADPSREAVDRGHERDDLPIRQVVILVTGFIAAGAVLLLLLVAVQKAVLSQKRPEDRPSSSVIAPAGPPVEAPPLQPRPDHDALPRDDLAQMHLQEDSVFQQLGWKVDPRTHRPVPPASVVQAVRLRAGAASRPAVAPTGVPAAAQPVVTPIPGVDEASVEKSSARKEAADADR